LLVGASGEDRHLALSVAADLGYVETVRLLLDAGENPNRYNPVGGHSHATPLHQAAGRGHEEVVQLLVRTRHQNGFAGYSLAGDTGGLGATRRQAGN